MIVSLWVCIARHAQSTQINKFTISLQYLKKSVKDEVIFLPANTRRRFLQIDAIILGVVTRHAQIIQNNKFAISLQCLKKKAWWSWFLHADKQESLLQIDTMILMAIFKHSQSSQNSKFAISLQYLKKKRSEMKLIFYIEINIKVSTSWHYPFWWKWQSLSKAPKIGTQWYFGNILRKKSGKCFRVLLWCQTFRYFMGSSHVRCYLFSIKSEKFFKFKLYNSSVNLL